MFGGTLSCVVYDFDLVFVFCNDTATTEIYTLSLHDALPICPRRSPRTRGSPAWAGTASAPRTRPVAGGRPSTRDRKSTRLNSSHANISYAVFCLKKKNNHQFCSH